MIDKWTLGFMLCICLISGCLAFYGCRHLNYDNERTTSTAADVVIAAPKSVKPKAERKNSDIVMYKGHEYVVYTVQGSYLGLTHSSDCYCKKKGAK